MNINLQENYGISLNMVWLAEELFKLINNQNNKEVILDFTGIKFISLSFAQAYVNFKRHSEKEIKEINLSKENKIMLQVVADKFAMNIG